MKTVEAPVSDEIHNEIIKLLEESNLNPQQKSSTIQGVP